RWQRRQPAGPARPQWQLRPGDRGRPRHRRRDTDRRGRRLADHVRGHHRGPDRRRDRRPGEVLHLAGLRRPVGHPGLLPDGAHGLERRSALGRRTVRGDRRTGRLRRRPPPAARAPAPALLAPPPSRDITGQTLSVSGGLTMACPRSRTSRPRAESTSTMTDPQAPPPTLLRTAVTDRIGTLTLHRPEQRNALNAALLAELAAVLDAWEADDRVQGVILTGSGEKAFAAGADISEVASWDLA